MTQWKAFVAGSMIGVLGAIAASCGEPDKSCDRGSCPNGCCTAQGVCLPGETPANCGGHGNACSACSPGLECQDTECVMSVDGGSDGGLDAGVDAGVDAGTDGGADDGGAEVDGGTDAGESADAGNANSAIEAVRAAADATPDGGSVSLAIRGATVTYVKPQVPDAGAADVPGFFLQGSSAGPAVFVAVDPGVAGGGVGVGDEVDVEITGVAKVDGLRRITSANVTKRSAGHAVGPWVADVSGVDWTQTAQLDLFESRLVSVSGSVVAEPTNAGTGFRSVNFNTVGTPDAGGNVRLRLPIALMASESFGPGCSIALSGTPLWRFQNRAQPSAWTASELSGSSCPAPTVLSATAPDAGLVHIRFSRDLKASTIAVDQFTVAPAAGGDALTLGSATLATPRRVELATSPQNPVSYSVTVGAAVTDQRGTAVAPTANSATFNGVPGG